MEGIAGPDGTPHPVQTAMIDLHGSHRDSAPPGFIVSMATAHANGARTTMTSWPKPAAATGSCPDRAGGPRRQPKRRCRAGSPATRRWPRLPPPPAATAGLLSSADGSAAWYLDNPTATLVAGAATGCRPGSPRASRAWPGRLPERRVRPVGDHGHRTRKSASAPPPR